MVDEYSKPPYNKQSNIPSDCSWEELKKLSGVQDITDLHREKRIL